MNEAHWPGQNIVSARTVGTIKRGPTSAMPIVSLFKIVHKYRHLDRLMYVTAQAKGKGY